MISKKKNCVIYFALSSKRNSFIVRKKKVEIVIIRILKRIGNTSSSTILNKVVLLFSITGFGKRSRSPPYFDLISKIIQIGGKEDGL